MATVPELQLPDVEAMTAEEALLWAYEQFGDRMCLTCSWQRQSSVLVHMVFGELGLDVPVVELDTQLFFKETYETRDRLVERYGLRLERPEVITVAQQAIQEGPNLWETQPRPLLPHPQGRAARAGARSLRRVDHRHPPRAGADARRCKAGRMVGALRRLEDPARRRLGRQARPGVHPRQRDSLQPAARCGLSVHRLHPVHSPRRRGRGRASGTLGRLGQARVRHPRQHATSEGEQ